MSFATAFATFTARIGDAELDGRHIFFTTCAETVNMSTFAHFVLSVFCSIVLVIRRYTCLCVAWYVLRRSSILHFHGRTEEGSRDKSG